MKRIFAVIFAVCLLTGGCNLESDARESIVSKKNPKKKKEAAAKKEAPAAANPQVRLITNKGEILVELDEKNAPISTRNFLSYAESGFYDGTIFHRVIKDFMVQGGGFDAEMNREKSAAEPIKNEADNGLQNLRGTLAMARTQVVDSATSQFFINLNDNAFLNHGFRDFGYAVFGKVVEGMEIVDQIAKVRTTNKGGHDDVPVEPVLIEKAVRVR